MGLDRLVALSLEPNAVTCVISLGRYFRSLLFSASVERRVDVNKLD